MTRFDRSHHSYGYDYDYTGGRGTSAWDTRTFIGVDNDDDGDETDQYSRATLGGGRRPAAAAAAHTGYAASVIGYGDLEFRPRTRPPSARDRDSHSHRARDRDRDRDRDTPRDRDRNRVRIRPARQRDASGGHSTGSRPSLKPSLSAGLPDLLERDTLKQRLCLDRSAPPTFGGINGPPSYPGYPRQHHHARARSLSLSRLSGGVSDSSLSGEEAEGGEDEDELDAHRDAWGVLPPAPGVPHSQSQPSSPPRHQPQTGPGAGYYLHERLSLSSPRVALREAGWPLAGSRPGSRTRRRSASLEREREHEREMRTERYERGYHQVVPDGGGHLNGEEDLRVRLGGLPNPRVPSGGHTGGHRRRRSESYDERFKGGSRRKGVSPGAGVRAQS
jgi:hypothetical protein